MRFNNENPSLRNSIPKELHPERSSTKDEHHDVWQPFSVIEGS